MEWIMITETVQEKRRFKRFDAYMDLKISTDLHGEFTGICTSANLSREGMKIRTNTTAQVGDVVDIEITIPEDPQSVHTAGKVMWVNATTSGGKKAVEMGVKFLMMEPMDKFRMLDFAYNKWLEKKIKDFTSVDREVKK